MRVRGTYRSAVVFNRRDADRRRKNTEQGRSRLITWHQQLRQQREAGLLTDQAIRELNLQCGTSLRSAPNPAAVACRCIN